MQSATSLRASLSCIRFANAIISLSCHGPARPGHPRLLASKTWMPGTRPGVTAQSSVSVACIDLVEHAQVCRPIVAAAAGIVMLILLGGLFADCRGNFDQLLAGGFQPELNVGSVDKMLHQHEGFARTFSHGEKTVVVHDHRAVLAKVTVQPLALVKILRDALVGVITDALIEADRLLGHHAKAAFESG